MPGPDRFVDRSWRGAHASRGTDDRARPGMPTGAMGVFPMGVLDVRCSGERVHGAAVAARAAPKAARTAR
jgi:hypothetical protein